MFRGETLIGCCFTHVMSIKMPSLGRYNQNAKAFLL